MAKQGHSAVGRMPDSYPAKYGANGHSGFVLLDGMRRRTGLMHIGTANSSCCMPGGAPHRCMLRGLFSVPTKHDLNAARGLRSATDRDNASLEFDHLSAQLCAASERCCSLGRFRWAYRFCSVGSSRLATLLARDYAAPSRSSHSRMGLEKVSVPLSPSNPVDIREPGALRQRGFTML